MHRKAVFFTFISLILVGVIVVAFSSQTFFTLKDKVPITKARVQTADNYVKNLKFVYLERSVFISSIQAMHALSLYVNATGYLADEADLNDKFTEILLNGTVGQVDVDTIIGKPVMAGNTLQDRMGAIEQASQDILLINTTFQNSYDDFNVVLFQDNETGAFAAGVNATLNILVDAGAVRWNISQNITVLFGLDGLDDPLYMANKLSNHHTNKLSQTDIDVWNTTSLSFFLSNHSYRHEKSAPSYLQRFYDDLGTPSLCCGLESLVDPVTFGYGSSEQPKSYVDWCFYSTACAPDNGGQIWKITGITDLNGEAPNKDFFGFQLDTPHTVIYNVTDDTYQDGS